MTEQGAAPTGGGAPGTPGADGEADSVKDIRSGDQVEADAATWTPVDPSDLAPRLTSAAAEQD